jgi:hypothetical protein
MEGLGRHRPVPLGHKDVRGQPLFALQTSQGAYLVALHRVDTGRAVLRPANGSCNISMKRNAFVPMTQAPRCASGKKLSRPSTQRVEPSEKKSLKKILSLKNRRQLGGISGQFSSIPVTHRRYPTTSRRIAMRRKMAQKLSRRTRLQLTGRGRNHPPRRGIFSAAQAGEVGDQPVGFLQRSALIFLRPQSRLLSAHLSRMITGRGVLMTLRAL